MAIDKKLMLETFKASAVQTKELFDGMERVFGRYNLYRLIFDYPKKWSKRKVKKRGKRDMQYVRMEIGVEQGAMAIAKLGPEYAALFKEKDE